MVFDDLPIEPPVVPPTPETPTEIQLESRNILNSQGNVLGHLSFPVGTDESIWTAKIAEYASTHTPTLDQIINTSLQAAIDFGIAMVDRFKKENVMMGITQAGKTHDVLKYLHFATHCMESGSLYGAIDELNILIADSSDAKTVLAPFVTNARMIGYKNSIQVYLGLPLT